MSLITFVVENIDYSDPFKLSVYVTNDEKNIA